MKGFAVVTPKKITANSLRTEIAYRFELLTIFNFPRVVDCHYLYSGCSYALKHVNRTLSNNLVMEMNTYEQMEVIRH